MACQRLSTECADQTGCDPAMAFEGDAGAGARDGAASSETDGLSGGFATAASLLSAAFEAAVVGGGGSVRLASITLGLAGIGAGAGARVVAVVSEELPRPTLRASELKKPSDCFGVAEATRVAGAAGVP